MMRLVVPRAGLGALRTTVPVARRNLGFARQNPFFALSSPFPSVSPGFVFADPVLDDFFSFPHHVGPSDFFSPLVARAVPQQHYQEPSFRTLEHAIELEFEVPRFAAEDITVSTNVARGELVIVGERKSPRRGDASRPSFRRRFTLDPDVYDLAKTTHHVQDGLLTVTIPFAARKEVLPEGTVQVNKLLSPSSGAEQQKGTSEKASPSSTASSDHVTVAQSNAVTDDETFFWPPKVDVVAKNEQSPLTFTVALPPGVAQPDVSLRVLPRGLLQLKLSHASKTESQHGFTAQQLAFSRTFPLPEGTTKEDVSATLADGKLTIVVKEKEASAARETAQQEAK